MAFASSSRMVFDLFLVCTVIFLMVIIWSIKHHREPRLRINSDAPIADLLPSLAGLTHSTLVEGNSAELIQNGAYFDELISEMGAAKKTLHFETYLWEEGEASRRVTAALAERARAGVKVRVLVDASGGNRMGEAAPRELIAAGCQFQIFHPRRFRNIGLQNERDHRKLAVIDGRVAIVGGHCVKDNWLGNAQDKQHFRDMSARLRGPIVGEVQSTFSENWVEETGEVFVGDDVFPRLERAGDMAMHVARAKPSGAAPGVKILYHLVLCMARERIWIQNPYFLPGPAALVALRGAAKRGVDVRVMVPEVKASDMPLVQHAAHRNFDILLAAGVRIFEYEKTLLHQKVLTVDGAWCAFGSSNFDDRSLEINDEITIGCASAELAAQFEEVFRRDAEDCVELEAGSWERRGLLHRLRDNASYLLKYQL
ncbi:MAG TPA: phospholipase D-like domain-containing protein [Burkholderiales bacterium]|nr:phospholipase D-like domain-containing protein [Burkholderiales bacterium]